MNTADSNGTIHIPNRAGRHTACRTYIKPRWKETDTPVTCAVCRASTVYAESLLAQLGCKLLNSHLCDVWRIEVLSGVPEVIVEKPRDEVLAWCEKRIESRKSHKNKALRISSGGASAWSDGMRATKI